MPYYRFDNGLQPLSAPPEDWQGVLAVLEPSELHSAPLPSWLTPPAAPADPHESQFCWLRIDRDGVTGHLRTPVRASQSARHMGFTWTRDCLLLSDPDHAAADCIAHLTTQRTQPPGSPDAFVVALLIASDPEAGTIMSLVSKAWGVFGAAFGPAIMLSLFWKRFTFSGAVAGILVGAGVDVLWLLCLSSTGIYEIIPGTAAGLIACIVVSLLSRKPDADVEALYDKAVAYTD